MYLALCSVQMTYRTEMMNCEFLLECNVCNLNPFSTKNDTTKEQLH